MYELLAQIFPSFLEPIAPFALFVLSLALLVKSADFFIDFAEELGLKLGIPHFIIGITVIGIGTSLPELATSISSVLQSTPENNLTEIVSANVIGSNIANILLGIGIASLITTVKVDRNLQDNDLPFLFGSTAIAMYFMFDGVISRGEGFILLSMFIVFLAFSLFEGDDSEPSKELKKDAKRKSVPLLLFLIASSGVGIIAASSITITSLTEAAPTLGIEKDVASMILLAIGTSFPEIFVSVMAVQKGKVALAIGNILGSNIGNILAILGISALMSDIQVSEKSIMVGLPFMAMATLFFIFAALDNRFRKWEGMMTLAIFIAFLGSLFDVL
jgi:cation:H+ antiporter